MPDQPVDNFESLRRGRPNLVQCESIQSLERHLNFILSPELFHKFLCVPLMQVSYERRRTH